MEPLQSESDEESSNALHPQTVEIQNIKEDEQPFINEETVNTLRLATNCSNYQWKCICCYCSIMRCSAIATFIVLVLLLVIIVLFSLMGYFDSVPAKALFCNVSTTNCTRWNTSNWDYIVATYVHPNAVNTEANISGNMIDYCGIYTDSVFDAVITELTDATIQLFDKDEQFALYINAYNILAIKMVLDHPVSTSSDNQACPVWVDSITDISDNSGLKTVWKMQAGTVGGQMYSLDNIEHDTLRKYWSDARVHSSIVCASLSCPNLRTQAYRGESIDEQLHEQFNEWMNNTSKGLAVVGDNQETLQLSKIFEWYGSDFLVDASTVKLFILQEIDDEKLRSKVSNTSNVQYFDYDWNLNILPANSETQVFLD